MEQLFKWMDPLAPEKLTLLAIFWLVKAFFNILFERFFGIAELPKEK